MKSFNPPIWRKSLPSPSSRSKHIRSLQSDYKIKMTFLEFLPCVTLANFLKHDHIEMSSSKLYTKSLSSIRLHIFFHGFKARLLKLLPIGRDR